MRKKVDIEVTLKDKKYFDTWDISSDGSVYRNFKWVVPVDPVVHNKTIGIAYILKQKDSDLVEVLTAAWDCMIPMHALTKDSQDMIYDQYPEIFL